MIKSLEKLKSLKRQCFTTKEAVSAGVSPRSLNYLLNRGLIERRAQGLYIFAGTEPEDIIGTIKERLLAYTKAIVGLNTAVTLYDLTDDAYDKIDLIVPNGYVPKLFDDVKIFQTRTPLSKIETTILHDLPVTSIEQTIVDLLRTGEPLSKVLDIYYRAENKRIPVAIPKLKKIAANFRAKAKIKIFLEAIL